MAKEKKYGKYYRKRIKCADGKYRDVYGKTIVERDRKVRELLAQVEQTVADEKGKTPADVYVYEYAAAWFKRTAPHLREPMQNALAYDINKNICPVIGDMHMRDVTLDNLKDVMAGVAKYSKSYNRRVRLALVQMFTAAHDAGVIPTNPTLKLKAAGKPPKKIKALTHEQQGKLLEVINGQRIYTFIMVALYTGMRREEICGLMWDSVDLDSNTPHVIVQRACRWENHNQADIGPTLKSDAASRVIPIPPQLVDALKAEKAYQRAELPHCKFVVHTADGKPMTYAAFRSQWHAVTCRCATEEHPLGSVIRNAKIEVELDFAVTPHILRHTYITRLVLGGADVKRIQYLAGHADPNVTIQIYTDLMGHTPADLSPTIMSVFAPPKSPQISGE